MQNIVSILLSKVKKINNSKMSSFCADATVLSGEITKVLNLHTYLFLIAGISVQFMFLKKGE
jgi:hypothetical protein